MDVNANKGELQIPARSIPVPTTISPQARNALAAGSRLSLPTVWPPFEDKAGWLTVIDEFNGQIAAMTAALPPFPGTVEARQVGRATLYEMTPHNIPEDKRDRAVIALHGGGYVFGGGRLVVDVVYMFAVMSRTKVYALDYRMPPEHPYPAALDDVVQT